MTVTFRNNKGHNCENERGHIGGTDVKLFKGTDMETIVGHNCGNFKGHGSENYGGDSKVDFLKKKIFSTLWHLGCRSFILQPGLRKNVSSQMSCQ